jgi:hypothetical protein
MIPRLTATEPLSVKLTVIAPELRGAVEMCEP